MEADETDKTLDSYDELEYRTKKSYMNQKYQCVGQRILVTYGYI